MRNRGIKSLLLTFLIMLAGFLNGARAYNMRQTFSGDGLSNSAILSLCLDDYGWLWIGTCDGVNIANGAGVQPFKSLFPERTLSGNIIESIKEGGKDYMWILTNYGLDLFDTKTWELKTFPQFHGQELIYVDKGSCRTYVLTEDSRINVYEPGKDSGFRDLGKLSHGYAELACIMEREGMLWAAGNEGIYVYDLSKSTGNGATLSPVKEYRDIKSRFAKEQGGKLLSISPEGDICEIMPDGSVRKIASTGSAITSRGRISNMVHDRQGNFFVSFFTDGVLWVGLNEAKEYMSIDLGLNVGVFSLERSPSQDVVWIGSDCQGVYTFWDDSYSIHSYDFNALDNKISHPVRAIWLDDRKNLWVGTKGDGLLKISDFNQGSPRGSLDKGYLYTSANSELCHNSVYAFGPSSRPLLWIGTDEGLNYYSYTDNRLHRLPTSPRVTNIHAVYEENDSTLWMTTLGMGVIRAIVRGGSDPRAERVDVYSVDGGQYSMNQFFSLAVSDKGNILFCNRGKGVYEFRDGALRLLPLKSDFGTNVVNDVFVAVEAGDVLWLGTGEGLIKSSPEGEKRYAGVEDGFANNTIHDMIRVDSGMLWISTNSGIVRFDPREGRGLNYGKSYGLSVTEYSDGAAFYNGNGMIFGGINGLTFISRHLTYAAPPEYKPDLTFMKLTISGEDVPMVDYLERGKDGKMRIVLDPDQNYFSLMVGAPDFVNAHNYIYTYSLDGANWINNGPETTISFNGMAYGKYNLRVRYMNRATGIESEPSVIEIVVKAPWYLSAWAKTLYFLIFLGLVAFGVTLYLRRQKERQKEAMKTLEQTHKEELYEEKLRFFTNITHEFCTPLTLIYGPCERILHYPGSDDYIKRYVGLVRTNAERLNTLIQELIDFRRMETGHKQLKLSTVGFSGLCSDIVTSFSELADRNRINLIEEIEPDIDWVTDFGCVRKIMTNLISNAFKYTPTGGTIKIGLRREGDKLRLSVYNTGKGISAEEKKRIFNRYSVLDNVEENAVKGLSSRNGLGLAICHSMVDILHGRISIESEVGEYADFIVELPQLELPQAEVAQTTPAPSAGDSLPREGQDKEGAPEGIVPVGAAGVPESELPGTTGAVPLAAKGEKSRVLVVDDNREILLLLCDALSEYEVLTAETADKALEIIRNTPPDLIVSDIMMPGTDGVTFTRMIKQNKHTMHIPLVLLSAKTSNQEKVEGIDSGADAYIGKPFSIDYLEAVVRRLLENRAYLKQYYTTGASAFEYTDGHLMHRDDKDFMEQLVSFIDEHVDDEDLGPEKIATHMKISLRNLYRKFKELDLLAPNDFIKHQRVSFAARMLVSTSATVQEIIYRSGFNNRSHFYKEFDKRFGMTPKQYRATHASKDLSLAPEEEE